MNANANQHQQATRRGGNAYLRMAVCPWRCYTAVSLSLFLEDDGVPTLLKRQVPLLARRLRSAQDLSTRQALGVPPSILSSFFGFVPRCRSISESPFGLAAGGRHGKAGLDIEIRWSLRVRGTRSRAAQLVLYQGIREGRQCGHRHLVRLTSCRRLWLNSLTPTLSDFGRQSLNLVHPQPSSSVDSPILLLDLVVMCELSRLVRAE